MAMRRRKFGFRRRTPRRTFRRRPGFARQKFDKIVLFNNLNAGQSLVNGEPVNGELLCSPLDVSSCSFQNNPPDCGAGTNCGTDNPCRCCLTTADFVLVNNDTLQSYFQDSVTIVRLYGDIWYRAVVATPFGAEHCSVSGITQARYMEAYAQLYGEHWVWSMRKRERTQSGSPQLAVDPASPIFNYDWTESSPPWLWQRNKLWFPKAQQTNWQMTYDSLFAMCANTTQPGYIVPPSVTGNNPGWVVDPTVTTCAFNGTENGLCPQQFSGQQVGLPPWHHLRLSSKKHIKMVRDQDLTLKCAIRHPQLAVTGAWTCQDPAIFPDFARAFDTSYQFYLRVAAVVRLN